MDKKAIKIFAIESRKKLIDEIKYQASLLGITADRIDDPVEKAEAMEVYDIGASTPNTIFDEAIKQRESLVKRIKEKNFNNVVEEVAYTWFNRIMAIRFMEVNDYLPTRIRVLSSKIEGKIEPDIVTEAPNIDLNLSDGEIEQIYQFKNENKLDELFRFLFIKQCNKLNEILPELFEKTADYTELLLSISFTNEDGIVRQLIENISEEDFTNQVEIIGWLYQYYNIELKADTFNQLKKRAQISKERIPAATQLFTPDWIVRYMVENSLGRLWLENHPNSNLKENWKYYLDEPKDEETVELVKIREDSKNIKPEDIIIIDPAMGSGHILVYAFDVLIQIYTSVGYSERDAAISILEKNLYGLDIDDRAYQLAYFAVMMKGRSYNQRILNKNITPQICSIQESNGISDDLIDFIAKEDLEVKKEIKYLKYLFKDAKEYGSLINVENIDLEKMEQTLLNSSIDHSNLLKSKFIEEINLMVLPLLKQAKILSQNYEVVITNPPYMGNKLMDKNLSDFMKKNYQNTKTDLFAAFIEKCMIMLKENGFCAMITQQSWMYLTSFNNLRKNILTNYEIKNIIHLGSNSFEEISGEVVQSCSFVIRNIPNLLENPLIINLIRFEDSIKKKEGFLKKNYDFYSSLTQKDYLSIPDYIFMYKLTIDGIKVYTRGLIGDYFEVKRGPSLKSNKKYLRKWFEVSKFDISLSENDFGQKKWCLCSRSGSKSKWYEIVDEIIDNEIISKISNFQSQNKKGVVWPDSRFGARIISARIKEKYFAFESGVNLIEVNSENDINTLLAYFNSYLYDDMLSNIVNGQHFSPIYIKKLPFKLLDKNNVSPEVKEIINILKDIEKHIEISPFFEKFNISDSRSIETSFNLMKDNLEENINKIKQLEQDIEMKIVDDFEISSETSQTNNRYFFVSLTDASYVKRIISYAVGCMFGRYSLDEDGLIYSGEKWNINRYSKFIPDEDNIIPILDTEYFEDDIVGRFVEFVKVTFGEEKLEENLDFIAKNLKKKGKNNRDIIRNYFLIDFYKDHEKTYKNHPIYWQFDSGPNNGFKALIYMHRYEPYLVARLRKDYLHITQKALETSITQNDRIIETSSSTYEKTNAVKLKNKLMKQFDETRKYDEALSHIAYKKIQIDLDDGVEVNYAKFQGVELSKEGIKSTKINLLK